MLLVGQPTPTSWVNDVLGEAGFWKAVRLERSVGRMVAYSISPIADCLAKGPTMWRQRGFCEEEKIRGLLVQHRNDVDQGKVVGARLLNDYGKEFEFYGCRSGGRRLVVCRGPSSSGICGGSITVLSRVGPFWTYLGQVREVADRARLWVARTWRGWGTRRGVRQGEGGPLLGVMADLVRGVPFPAEVG